MALPQARSAPSGHGRPPNGRWITGVLRVLQTDGSAPRAAPDLPHRLRKIGNTAVHDAVGERLDAFDAIRTAHQLGVGRRASLTNQPRLAMAFRPPQLGPDGPVDLRGQVEALREQLAETETAAETAARRAREGGGAAGPRGRARQRPRRGHIRLPINEQPRATGWEADSRTLHHGRDARRKKSRHRAIVEWPMASNPAEPVEAASKR